MVVSIGQVGTSFRSNVDAPRFRRHHLEKGGEEGQTIRTRWKGQLGERKETREGK